MGGVVEAVVNVVSSFISWIIPIPEVPEFDTPESAETPQGVLINKESNNAQIPVVYGERRLGCTRVFVETSGTDNKYLYVAAVLCEGEIESIERIYIDDKEVTWDRSLSLGQITNVDSSDSTFYSNNHPYIQVQAFRGTDTQTASQLLKERSSTWGNNHRLRGVAYLALRFEWNQDMFGGVPNIKADVKGKKIYDPRTTTTAYSNNSALCLLDYLRNARYGKGLPNDAFESNFQSFQDAADECETQVTPYSGGSNIDLFETNAVLDTSQKVIENVKKLLNPMRSFFTYTEGVYKLTIEGTGTAVKTITSDNVVGGAKLLGERKNQKYNRIIATFCNPSKDFQEDTITYPPNDDSGLPSADQHATMLADDGVLLEGNFSFPNVTSVYQAQGLAEVILRRSRNQLQVQVRVTSEFLDVAVGDIVQIDYPTGGFNNKPFRVLGMTINEDLTVDLQLFEHQDNFYSWTEKAEEPTIPDTTLPNPISIEPPSSLTLTDDLVEYNDGTVITRLRATIGASPDQFVDQYEVEVRQDTDRAGDAIVDDFRILGRGNALEYQMLNVIDSATYTVRVRAINTLGVRSTYVTQARQIIGQTAIPSDVEDFSINVSNDQALLSWSPIKDLDLDYYVIKFSTDTVNPTWQNSVDLVDRVARPATSLTVPLQTGSYLIKAQDKLGNQSGNETIVTTNIASVNYVNQTTINEHTAFTGTKTDVSLVTRNGTNYIGLTATGTVGDTATRVPAEGTYEFTNTIDLGAKFKAQFTASIKQFIEDVSEVFDNGRPTATTLFDDGRPNPFDGTSSGDAHTLLQISTSDDNVTYSAFRTFAVGEHIGRYFKFRVKFTSDNLKARSLIEELTVAASLPKRRESGNDISSGTGGKVITFDYAFKLNPSLGIAAQNMDTGDYYTITSKSTSGFTIEFFDSSATSVDRTFDYIAEGVGQVIT